MTAYTVTKRARLFQQVRYGKCAQIVKIERRETPIPAQPRTKAGNCYICDEAIMVSADQLIRVATSRNGNRRITHKKCRGRGKNKERGV